MCSYSREFTHRVKSVSMAKFTTQEVEALQNGGNQVLSDFIFYFSLWKVGVLFSSLLAIHSFQRAREIYLKDWDLQRQRLPDSR